MLKIVSMSVFRPREEKMEKLQKWFKIASGLQLKFPLKSNYLLIFIIVLYIELEPVSLDLYKKMPFIKNKTPQP